MVQIHPSDFSKTSERAIEDYINTKYADKVIHKVGLCVGFHSIISVSDGLIGHGTGTVNVNVDFRLVVYRPFKGEILQGTITHSGPDVGIYLSQDFFEDIVIPPEVLFENTVWTKDDKGKGDDAFVWYYENEESGVTIENWFDRADKCLYRVEEEQWHDLSPEMQKTNQSFLVREQYDDGRVRKTPYVIRGSMGSNGLGPTVFWEGE